MRILIPAGQADTGVENAGVDDVRLRELYAAEPKADGVWLRVNMVSTADGSAQGDDGRSDGINNAADKRVYDLLRDIADVLLVGAETVRVEKYRPAEIPLVVVSRTGVVPETLRGHEPGRVLLATVEHATGIDEARELLGADNVLVMGAYVVDLVELRAELGRRGYVHVLNEGGPHLLRDLLSVGVVDELCLSVVPRLVGGEHERITAGQPVDVPLEPTLLLEQDGTLLGRWRVVNTTA